MGGGHIEGYFIDDIDCVVDAFSKLLEPERLKNKYGRVDNFLFAVGDGNHSLATAKTHWNNLKKDLSPSEMQTHPARYALVELVNVYDEGIYFEPIYRYVFNVDRQKFISGLASVDGGKMRVYDGDSFTDYNGENGLPEGIRAVDKYIKEFIEKEGGAVDYVHGQANLKKLIDENERSVGILFEKLNKQDLFKYVSKNGAFPRKTFSMGEGVEKRYYLEGRRITK